MSDIKLRIRHTMLPVRDLDHNIDFYIRCLGMDVKPLRRQDENTRVGYLGYGSEDDGPTLELIEVGQSSKILPWAGHIAIMVSDLHKLCDHLKADGVPFTQEPKTSRPGSPDLMAHIVGPDGYAFELKERHTLTGPPSKHP